MEVYRHSLFTSLTKAIILLALPLTGVLTSDVAAQGNQPPVVTVENSAVMSLGLAATDIPFTATDPEQGALTISAYVLPTPAIAQLNDLIATWGPFNCAAVNYNRFNNAEYSFPNLSGTLFAVTLVNGVAKLGHTPSYTVRYHETPIASVLYTPVYPTISYFCSPPQSENGISASVVGGNIHVVTPDTHLPLTTTIVLKVTDPLGATVTKQITLSKQNVPPTFGEIGDLQISHAISDYVLAVPVSDLDGDGFTLKASIVVKGFTEKMLDQKYNFAKAYKTGWGTGPNKWFNATLKK